MRRSVPRSTGAPPARRSQTLPGGGLNIAYQAVGRHVAEGRGDRIAFRHIGRDEALTDISFADLDRASSRFANVLEGLGIERGAAVFSLSGRVPAFYGVALGTLKRGAVFCPLFSAFGPEPIRARLEIGHGQVLVTTRALFLRKVGRHRSQPAGAALRPPDRRHGGR